MEEGLRQQRKLLRLLAAVCGHGGLWLGGFGLFYYIILPIAMVVDAFGLSPLAEALFGHGRWAMAFFGGPLLAWVIEYAEPRFVGPTVTTTASVQSVREVQPPFKYMSVTYQVAFLLPGESAGVPMRVPRRVYHELSSGDVVELRYSPPDAFRGWQRLAATTPAGGSGHHGGPIVP